MIDRYSLSEMATIWTDASRYRLWFEIETHVVSAMEELGTVPPDTGHKVEACRPSFTPYRVGAIQELERETRHDFVAFLRDMERTVGPELAPFLHRGLTSSDITDTAFNLQLVHATRLLIVGVARVMSALQARAVEHKHTLCVGRTHGMYAEPTTFGLKLLGFYAEFRRARTRLTAAMHEISVCAISGPVGNYSNINPRVEQIVAQRLGLRVEPVSTQVIPRDRHAMYFATLGVVASSVERLATELRHLQRSDVAEVEEVFDAKAQVGSSAMPHKRNPITAENLCGLARMVRAMVIPAMENVALWHERDISHSSVERLIGPDATGLLDYVLNRLARLVQNLEVNAAQMARPLLNDGVNSQAVMLALMQDDIDRATAHRWVQTNSPEIENHLSRAEIARLCGRGVNTAAIDETFERVFRSA